MNDELKLTEAQWKAIRFISREFSSRQVAGYGMGGMLSASRALVRKGLAFSSRTGHFGLTSDGKALIEEAMRRIPQKVSP